MVKPVRRRAADPQVVIQLWTGVACIKQQKQIPNHERVNRYMDREYNMKKSDCERQLRFASEDGVLISYNSVKGTRNRLGQQNFDSNGQEYEQEGFRLPDIEEEVERDDHDWYCFDCHQPGEVILCSECWRVYHPTCTEEPWTGDTFLCAVCVELEAIKKQPRMKRKELNKLISYTVSRLKSKMKDLHRFGGKEGKDEDLLKLDKLVFRHIDLETMEAKSRDRKYKYLEQFYADARTLLHNTFICYGDNSYLGNLAKLMIRDCKYDLDEIRQCKDCYYYSNAKPKDWFCQPCRPPHELVYAKQKGFSYWPAKVIKITKEGYDVRFFGAGHTRAIVTENLIKPIDTPVKQLGSVKRSSGFNRSCEELLRHQDLLEKVSHDPIEEEEEEGEQEVEEEYEPVIKHKKFRKKQREEERVVSSSNFDRQALTPEDHNLVTSTESTDNYPSSQRALSTNDIGTQTSKKLSHSGKMKGSQTDPSITEYVAVTSSGGGGPSDYWEDKLETSLTDLRLQLEKQYNAEKRKSLKDMEERIRREFEQDKQSVLNTSSNSHKSELDRVKRQTEERCREAYVDEVKKMGAKHRTEVSATKKKQWCYNCEEEAMYHCCWNTSYCSIKCQQEHWHREHKRMCRRKRN